MRIRVWTQAYRPFMLGGNVHAPIAADLTVDENSHVDFGYGFCGFLVRSPYEGFTLAVEHFSGGVIGNTLQDVVNDIEEAVVKYGRERGLEMMFDQINHAIRQGSKVEMIPARAFWRLMHR